MSIPPRSDPAQEDDATRKNASYHVADLNRGMEHLRTVVSVERPPVPINDGPIEEGDVYGVPASVIRPVRRPPGRPSSPSNTQKRSDPFQFGSRFLEEGDDIFEFNAWDHVEVDDAFRDFAEQQYQKQREDPMSDFDRDRINTQPAKPWNRFYRNNEANFFKNRKWLFQEFPMLTSACSLPQGSEDGLHLRNEVCILEIGAGAGNTAFPILAANRNPDLRLYAMDFSSSAVDVMRKDKSFDENFMHADVWDLGAAPGLDDDVKGEKNGLRPSLPPGLKSGSVDIALLIFTLSALSPQQWEQALLNIWTVLKPGGEVLFRDYGRGDLAQVRFKKGRWLDENFYARGDGTRVYFFDEEELRHLWQSAGRNAQPGLETQDSLHASKDGAREPSFEVVNLGVDRRMLVNRKRKLKMYRCWMQGRFRKPLT